MKQLKTTFVIALLLTYSNYSNSQLIYSGVSDLEVLITNIFGVQCQGITNVGLQGTQNQIARFENGSSLGVNSGLVLSTGYPNLSSAPSTSFASVNMNMPGDYDIIQYGNITGQGAYSYDAVSVQFDFTPIITDTIRFNYIFASEEYPEYSNTQYTDRFLFLVSENGGVPVNIANVPGTTVPVEINSINQFVNSQYYVDNSTGMNSTNFVFDAYTVPLEAKFFAQVGNTYHIKLVISDVSDGVYDSAIFLDEQEANNDISGSLTVNGQPAEGVLEVFNFVQDTLVATPVETVNVTNGSYVADSLPTGLYHVRFTPDPVLFPGAVPLYFATSSTWTGADAIGLPCFLNSANINADTLDVLSASGSVSGTIVVDTSYLKSLNVPFEGALMLLKNAQTHETRGFAYTASDGTYTINHVEAGSYYLLVDVPYIPHTDTLFFDVPAGGILMDADYAILTEGITINGTPYLGLEEYKEMQWSIAPNPADKIVEITSDKEVKLIQILTIDGAVVTEIYPSGGGFKTSFDISNLKQGVYLVRMDQSAPKRLVVTKQ
ncbi:choice-of-anchor L domain-containing protein [Fluviicola chungangensis]|uniref:T9SS type A sorting domain-containing protein n=1 Tax=Fluviicola chungangensis TaxID=2597671 RepID=A0A556MNN0_9FLAO|nr:choice-of-anchor L domain-containing protein [Fluviicola chungangensis]TSJ41564.1 T9SS type A sorting domain-containing protein [Fluviicola chungangensis]